MRKFFALVKNEYIKLMASTGTWVMVILIALGSIAIPGLGAFVNYSEGGNNNLDNTSSSIPLYQRSIEQEQAEKYPGWKHRVEFYQYLIDNSISHQDWRYSVLVSLFAIDYSNSGEDVYTEEGYKEARNNAYGAYTEDIKSAVSSNDSLAYCRLMIEYNKTLRDDLSEDEVKKLNAKYQYRVDNNLAMDNSWKSDVLDEYFASMAQVDDLKSRKGKGEVISEIDLKKAEAEAATALYRIENNIEVNLKNNTTWGLNGEFSVWTLWCSSTGMTGQAASDSVFSIISIIGVFAAIIAGGIVAGEFSDGTIKFLLINPTKRWKIITAKYFTVLSVGLIMIILSFIISGISSLAFMGTTEGSAAYIEVAGTKLSSIPGVLYIARRFLIGSLSVVVYASLAFAISSLMQSAALSVGISLLGMMGGGIVNLIMVAANFDWGRFLIFANTDFNSVIEGNPIYFGQTPAFSLGVVAVHMAVYLLIAWDGFTRKEV